MQLNFDCLEFCAGNASILEKIPQLPTEQPFSERRIDFLNETARVLLADAGARQYPDVVTFAFWIRRANMMKEKEAFTHGRGIRMGRGVVFHIAPSNVAVNYAYSFAASFVLGNAAIVRLPSKSFAQAGMINQAVSAVLETKEYQELKDYIVFVRYNRQKEINDYFSKICDMRVIWGGDASISEIRKSPLPPRAGEITFADRCSICVIDAGAYQEAANPEKIAQDFYNDTYLTDQNACTSPRLVCWLGHAGVIRQAKDVFWDSLHDVVCRKYKFQPIQFADKWVDCCMAAVKLENSRVIERKDNRIVRVQLESLKPAVLEYKGNSGFFYEYDLKDIMELAPVCNEKLQTAAYFGDMERMIPLLESGVKGIDRVTEIGKTMDFDFIWDGYDLTERLTRRVDIRRYERVV